MCTHTCIYLSSLLFVEQWLQFLFSVMGGLSRCSRGSKWRASMTSTPSKNVCTCCVAWLLHICTWLVHICDTTRSFLRRLAHIRSKRTASITHTLSGNVSVLLCDITNSYLRHVSFISATWLVHSRSKCGASVTCTSSTNVYLAALHDSFISATKLVYICEMTPSYWIKIKSSNCSHVVETHEFLNRHCPKVTPLQGGEDAQASYRCRSISEKKLPVIKLCCGNRPVKIRHPTHFRHPVPNGTTISLRDVIPKAL